MLREKERIRPKQLDLYKNLIIGHSDGKKDINYADWKPYLIMLELM